MARKKEPPQGRVVHAEPLKYTCEGVPAITPRLKRLGLYSWCTTSEPDIDCTGHPRIKKGGGRLRSLVKGSPTYEQDKEHNKLLELQRRTLQKICYELWEHYLELPVEDIGFLLGYSTPQVRRILDWEPGEDT